MLQHGFYRKGKVAVRFVSDRRGVLVKFAHARDDRHFNWREATSFSLDINECGEFLSALERKTEFRAYHIPPDGRESNAKVLSFRPSRGEKEGHALSLFFPNQKGAPNYFISLSPGEVKVLQIFLEESMKMLFNREDERRERRRNEMPREQEDENPF